ncbi:MAG: tetratricopeptide repeat protein [Bryobacteraceae bacterium]
MNIAPFAIASLAAFAFAAQCSAAQPDECRAFRHHGHRTEARACFTALLKSDDAFARAEGYWGLDQYEEANEQFRMTYKQGKNSAAVRVEWGCLFLERFNPAEAANLFQEALKLDANYAPAYLGLARVAAQGYDRKAVDFARDALQHDPKLVEAHELLSYLALEDSNPKLAAEEAQKALTLSPEALDGLAVLASMDWLNGKPRSDWIDGILKVNPVYGKAYATGAHFFVINRRYEEGIKYYRMALQLDADLWAARSQLGVNLMRLGFEDEARQQLERCYEARYRDAETVNCLRLLDTLKDYQAITTGPTTIILHKKEAALLRPYIKPELDHAISTYQQKYKMKLPGPVRLEVYPNHEDFVVRTLGLPGQGGLLGVTFGRVVAMDSPSARAPGEFNWASTMWHELSHVYVLTATNHLVPRWFTEGLAVHEEGAASPDWGDRMTPEIVGALRAKKLLPVLELDRGFVRPEYPAQVIVSYFEAGKICDYIAQKWGNDAMLGMIHSYANRKTTAEAIQENLHQTPADFDQNFSLWLDQQTGNTVRHFDEWKQGLQATHAALRNGNKDEAIREGLKLRDYYPDYVGSESAYEVLGDAYLSKGDKAAALRWLTEYRDKGGRNLSRLTKLAGLEQDSGQPAEAENTLRRFNYIYPEDEEVHYKLGGLLLDRGDASGAIREYQAVLQLQPGDPAESHYDLAKALRAAHRIGEAKDQVLLALEEAPDFKPAQQLLLQLSQ